MIRGISFEIPNKYGRYLKDILNPFEIQEYNWRIGAEESYLIVDSKLGDLLFQEPNNCMDGKALRSILEENDYYLIFQDLKAFPKGKDIKELKTFEEYLNSDCQLVLLVVDSSYITIYCKNTEKVNDLYINAKNRGFKSLEYITDENNMRTGLSVW
ncbi:DUF2691 family protein [Cohnella sp. CFH 77786]|uniref:DUF2691 family protein n=1 Tax=Cohnella sp. CFH 77786 TaxID=2662265 RepID=UPI001C608D50|nr:DUF2691 family protein [Cohnella sp. CFH 77786]MBW5449443.1 DUF2691 family protein [Cohnella sp. CFH 77786]